MAIKYSGKILVILVCAVFCEKSFSQDSLFVKETNIQLLYISFGTGAMTKTQNEHLLTIAPEYNLTSPYKSFVVTRQNITGDHLWSTRLNNTYAYADITEDNHAAIYVLAADTLGHTQLIKLSADGIELWRKRCDESTFSKNVIVIDDFVYITGSVESSPGNSRHLIVKFDLDGNLIWSKKYTMGYNIEISESIKTNDNHLLITSNYNQSLMSNDNQLHLLKIDTNGTVIWSKKMSITDDHEVYGICETTNGEFVLTGAVYDPDPDIFFMRISATGDFIAGKLYHEQNFQEAFGIAETDDGNFMICAEPEAFFDKTVPQIAMLKVSPAGEVLDFVLQDISDEGFFPIGFVKVNANYWISGIRMDTYNLVTIKTNEQGYTKCFDHAEVLPSEAEFLTSVDKLITESPGPNFSDFDGGQNFFTASTVTLCSALAEEPEIIHYLPDVPNVFTPDGDNINDLFVIDYMYEEGFEIIIIDRWGRTVFTSNTPSVPWNGLVQPSLEPASSGVYFYHLKAGDLTKHGFLTLIR
jgi:gliding motility-associated-like protein